MEQYPSWQSSREKVSDYQRRQPEEMALSRLIYHDRDDFERCWDELFAERYGVLRAEVLDAFDRYLNCGIIRHGCVRVCCEDCKQLILIAFSCPSTSSGPRFMRFLGP